MSMTLANNRVKRINIKKISDGTKESIKPQRFVEVDFPDDFIKEYVKHARRFQLYRDDLHKIIAVGLIGHATRLWKNSFTGYHGNRIFLLVLGETNSGKTRGTIQIPYYTFFNYRKELGIHTLDSGTREMMCRVLYENGAQLFLITEFAGLFAKEYASGLPEFLNSLYDGMPYSHVSITNRIDLSSFQTRSSIFAATTKEQIMKLFKQRDAYKEVIVAGGFLPRFILMRLKAYTIQQWETLYLETQAMIENNDILGEYLLHLLSIKGSVEYSRDAIKTMVNSVREFYNTNADTEEEKDIADILASRVINHIASVAACKAISPLKNRKIALVQSDDVEWAIKLLKRIYAPAVEYLATELTQTNTDKEIFKLAQRIYRYISRKKNKIINKRKLMMNLHITAWTLDKLMPTLDEVFSIKQVIIDGEKYLCANYPYCQDCKFSSTCSRPLKRVMKL